MTFSGKTIRHPKRRFATKTEIAYSLNTSEAVVEKMDRKGEIPGATQIGPFRRFDLEVFEQWVDAGCPKQTRQEATTNG